MEEKKKLWKDRGIESNRIGKEVSNKGRTELIN